MAGAADMDKRLQRARPDEEPRRPDRGHALHPEQEGQTTQRDDAVQHVAVLPGRLVSPALGGKPRQAGTTLDGKKEVFAGQTPIKALGTTDQHSQVQLYREGPNDKIITFLEVERFDHEAGDPRAA